MHSSNNAAVQKYVRYYTLQQQGGNASDFIVYKGSRRWDQRGNGDKIGDSNRGVMRVVAPIVASGLSKFLTEAATSYSKGSDLKSAALGAIAPAIVSSISSFQSGKGGVRRKRTGKKRNAHNRKQSGTGKKRSAKYKNKKHSEDHVHTSFLLKKTSKRKSRKIKQAKRGNF